MRKTALLLAALALPAAAGAQDWRGPAAIEVQVEDAKGRNLGGAEVLLVYLSPDGGGSLPSVLTGADGRVTIGGLAAGRWSAEVRHSGHMSYRAELGISADGKPSVQSASHVMAPGATSTMKVKFSRGRGAAPAPAPPALVKEARPLAPTPPTPPTPAPPAPVPAPMPVAAAEKAPVKELPPGAPAAPAPRPSPTPAAANPASPAVPASPVPAATAEKAPVKAVPPVPTVAPTPAPMPAPAAAKAPVKELPPVPPVASAPAPMPAPAAAKAPVKELPPVPAGAPSPASVAPAPVRAPAAPVVQPLPPPAKPTPPPVAPLPAETKVPAPAAPAPAPVPVAAATPVAPAVPAAPAAPAAPAVGRARLCVECPPGESAAWGEAAIDGGATAGCPADLAARMKSVELSAVAELSAGLAASGAGCRVIAVELPAGARFTGYRYEAQSAGVAADCLPGRGCPAGGCRFPIEPVLRVEGNRTTLLVAFESTAPDLRRAVVAGYSTYNKR